MASMQAFIPAERIPMFYKQKNNRLNELGLQM